MTWLFDDGILQCWDALSSGPHNSSRPVRGGRSAPSANSPQGCLLLDGASHHAGDDPLLGEDVDDEDWGHGHQVAGEGHRVIRGEL